MCVNADIEYVLVKDIEKDICFYLAKERLEDLQKHHSLDVIHTQSGEDLVGKSYEPLFSYFSELAQEGAF